MSSTVEKLPFVKRTETAKADQKLQFSFRLPLRLGLHIRDQVNIQASAEAYFTEVAREAGIDLTRAHDAELWRSTPTGSKHYTWREARRLGWCNDKDELVQTPEVIRAMEVAGVAVNGKPVPLAPPGMLPPAAKSEKAAPL